MQVEAVGHHVAFCYRPLPVASEGWSHMTAVHLMLITIVCFGPNFNDDRRDERKNAFVDQWDKAENEKGRSKSDGNGVGFWRGARLFTSDGSASNGSEITQRVTRTKTMTS